jgi:hypothetical protein
VSVIDIAHVIRWLESQGRGDMAREVRELKQRADRESIAGACLSKSVIELEKRLERYEPRPKEEPPVNNWTGD